MPRTSHPRPLDGTSHTTQLLVTPGRKDVCYFLLRCFAPTLEQFERRKSLTARATFQAAVPAWLDLDHNSWKSPVMEYFLQTFGALCSETPLLAKHSFHEDFSACTLSLARFLHLPSAKGETWCFTTGDPRAGHGRPTLCSPAPSLPGHAWCVSSQP